jgi:hypothetical protein
MAAVVGLLAAAGAGAILAVCTDRSCRAEPPARPSAAQAGAASAATPAALSAAGTAPAKPAAAATDTAPAAPPPPESAAVEREDRRANRLRLQVRSTKGLVQAEPCPVEYILV